MSREFPNHLSSQRPLGHANKIPRLTKVLANILSSRMPPYAKCMGQKTRRLINNKSNELNMNRTAQPRARSVARRLQSMASKCGLRDALPSARRYGYRVSFQTRDCSLMDALLYARRCGFGIAFQRSEAQFQCAPKLVILFWIQSRKVTCRVLLFKACTLSTTLQKCLVESFQLVWRVTFG